MKSTTRQQPKRKRRVRPRISIAGIESFLNLQVQHVSLADIHPSPENDQLYSPIDTADPEIIALSGSIMAEGVREPLVLSRDGFILSGHRRYAAALLAGLTEVPCRVDSNVSRADDPERFLRLLREHNRQRIKTIDEKVREEVISVNPAKAHQALIEYRRQKAGLSDFANRLELGQVKTRKRISSAKEPMLNAVLRVLDERRPYWPLSDRQIHYAVLNDPPLRHSAKDGSVIAIGKKKGMRRADSRYCNDEKSYNDLTNLLTRARLEGRVPWESISDETRPVTEWPVHRDPATFIRDQLDGFMRGYWRDHLQSQTNHIELLVEKNTVAMILKELASRYCMRMTSGRGFCSIVPRYQLAERFRRSGKEKLVVLLVSDFDPEGMMIAESFARSMRDDFDIPDEQVVAIKVALREDQVQSHNLPKGGRAKEKSSFRDAFVARYGEYVWELEALEPSALIQLTQEAIDGVLDTCAFNGEIDREREDVTELEHVRLRALAAIQRSDNAHAAKDRN